MEEIWKDIVGYEGLYQVSNLGRVKALGRTIVHKTGIKQHYEETIRKIQYNKEGYRMVGLSKNGKQTLKRVARLVSKAFLPNPNNLPEVNHKDENILNDYVCINPDGTVNYENSNLEWCDRSYNINYGTRNKRVGDHYIKQVYQYSLDGKLLNVFNSLSAAAKHNNCVIGHLSIACRKAKEDITSCGCFFSYEPLTESQLEKAAEIKQFYMQHKNRHPNYNDIKTLPIL